MFSHVLSCSFMFFHVLSRSFMFFHVLSFSFSLFGAQNLIFLSLNFVTISLDRSHVNNQFWGKSRGVVVKTTLGPLFLFFPLFFLPFFVVFLAFLFFILLIFCSFF